MSELDLRALVLLLGAIGVMTSVVLLHLWRQNRALLPAAAWWGVGPTIIFVGTVLLALRGAIGAPVSIVLGNSCIIGGAIAMYMGSRRFWGEPLPRWPWIWLGLTAAVLFVFSVVWPNYPLRLTIVPGLMAVVQLAHLRLVWRHDHRSFASQFLLAWVAFSALALAVRSATAHLERPDADLFTPTLLHNVYLASYAFSLLGEGIGLVLLAQQRLQEHIRELATHDSLTGAMTRAAWWKAALHEVLRQRRQGTPLTVLMLDLDHFKRINDTHGHPMGDRVLRDFADRVRRTLRATDRFGRYGGEEFIVLLPDTGAQAGCALAERVRAQALQEGLPAYTVSIGVTELLPNDEPADPERALEGAIARADAALYQAKAQGRDRVVQAQAPAQPCAAAASQTGSGSAWATA
ncbi:MAG: GGDEF domain-containing protein [Tepidimonas sp.]|uniref:GGDEF domain-containing protein n=1 Tax=Tepidimonas sp. TaxID=2002775 RepID=UPI00298F17DD|nr:GGDEF domain-containing protein [Tepidimonas sp.]MCX7742827.1 GGDEF domain-containing protein [Tepidimonas sp.]MDW8336843.1 GGDEF domain-containing protein [Tepidimonas sp.]